MQLSSLGIKGERMDASIRLLRCCYELAITTHWLHINLMYSMINCQWPW